MLPTGISLGLYLKIWDNLGYPQNKVCCAGSIHKTILPINQHIFCKYSEHFPYYNNH